LEPPSRTLDDYYSQGIALVFILFIYALVRGGEYSFKSISNQELESLRNKNNSGAQRALFMLSDPESLFGSLAQISSFLEISLIVLIASLFRESSLGLVLLIAFTSVILVGYKLPFSIFEKIKIETAVRMSRFISMLKPLTAPINRINSGFLRTLIESREERETRSIEDFADEVDVSDSDDVEEKRLLKGIIQLSNTSVYDIMRHRTEVYALDSDMSSEAVMSFAIECGFSRMPVYEKSLDNIRGFLYVKDLVRYLKSNTKSFDWHKHIRKAYFVPGNKKINDLLEEFRQKKIHLAVVADEYGGTEGIVTLEDILEEIIGEISDETDKNEI
jgi:CBS domain containing-hemolysin-like protein